MRRPARPKVLWCDGLPASARPSAGHRVAPNGTRGTLDAPETRRAREGGEAKALDFSHVKRAKKPYFHRTFPVVTSIAQRYILALSRRDIRQFP